MEMTPYLSFKGNCKAAFKFYEQCEVPPEWSAKAMHGSIKIGSQLLMGADVAADQDEQPKGFSLSLQIKGVADAERIFRDLSAGDKVVMPLETTFWAARFGVVVDRFGIQWLINCEESA